LEAQATQISTKGSPNILPEICGELEAQAVQISTKGSPNILSEIREELEAQAVQIPRKGLSPLYLSSSRMRVIYDNWSATKQRPHPQSVAEISQRSVLSGDRIRQCETSSGSRHKDTDQCL